MKINNITLCNFGSYEGETIFDTRSKDNRNIILIGGKNGAGKTTLFTAMRLCLYGYMSMGYKNINSFYRRNIIKLINNNAKTKKPSTASVEMSIILSNGRSLDEYILKRTWVLNDTLEETFDVSKNGNSLNQADIYDFEKYLLSLIPPELFNLYFFDGEKITDFFMNEGSNLRIKEAFLTLCGYDTFEIMRKNFKRISSNSNDESPLLEKYLELKETLEKDKLSFASITEQLNTCIIEIENCESEIIMLEQNYEKKGGITQEEWNKTFALLKEEEKKREQCNIYFKKCANDIIPFIMIREQIEALKNQINIENINNKYRYFLEILKSEEIQRLMKCNSNEIETLVLSKLENTENGILDLSFEQKTELISQINEILSFEIDNIVKYKKFIKRSITKTTRIKKKLDSSSIASVQEYSKMRSELFEKKSLLLQQRLNLEEQLTAKKDLLEKEEIEFNKIQLELGQEIKQNSINNISAKSIIMLDKLQTVLYVQQIKKVEMFFRKEINTLMRKVNFIDDIKIDNEFNIHIYRSETITIPKLMQTLKTNSKEQIISLWGEAAFKALQNLCGCSKIFDIESYYVNSTDGSITLPIEIDKTSLSNGEKQIFTMALYHSLVQLCPRELPFIIDTPFARIDTEHRQNISKYFFNKLRGQVFILSTNEEISSSHVKVLQDKILTTYMLENSENKRTVVNNSYFEV